MVAPLTELPLESTALLGTLAPDMLPSLAENWSLTGAIPHHEGGTLLVLTHPETRATLGLQVRPRDDASPAWKRTPHLDLISHLPGDMPEPRGLHVLAPLAEHLHTLDGPGTRIIPAPTAGDAAPIVTRPPLDGPWQPEALSPFAFGRVYVLDLSSDCGLRCTFCSTRAKLSPRTSFDDAQFTRFQVGLRAARADGYDVLRISGLDPMAHPRVLELLEHARTLGFKHIHIYSPFTRLADAEQRRALLSVLTGTDYTLHVPIYGADADTHDAVTGVVGSFDAVCAALEGLVSDGAGSALTLLTVLVRTNVSDIATLGRFLRRWSAPIQVFLPFPTTRGNDDAFFTVATRHTDLVADLATCTPPMGLSELLPCVRFHHEVTTGVPALTVGGFHPMTALLGTLFEHADYRRVDDVAGNTYTIPVKRCPHSEGCALAGVCPKTVYTAYARQFGLDEMRPVSADALTALSPDLAEISRPA